MSDDLMLKCLICFILGWLASRMMGNGFRVGGDNDYLTNKFADALQSGSDDYFSFLGPRR